MEASADLDGRTGEGREKKNDFDPLRTSEDELRGSVWVSLFWRVELHRWDLLLKARVSQRRLLHPLVPAKPESVPCV